MNNIIIPHKVVNVKNFVNKYAVCSQIFIVYSVYSNIVQKRGTNND